MLGSAASDAWAYGWPASGILWGKAAEYEAGGCVGDRMEDTIMHLTLTTLSHIIAGTRKCKFIYWF